MKKIMVVAIIALVCVVFGKMATAAEWEKSVVEKQGQKYTTYVTVEEENKIVCAVFLAKDNTLEVEACDWNNESCFLVQVVKLSSEGKIVSNKTNQETGPSIFTKCLKDIKSLPAEVRSKLQAFDVK